MDKIKQYLYGAYAAIVALLLAALYYLFSKTKNLEGKNSELKSELSVREQLTELQKQKEEADKYEDNYNDLKSKYDKQSKPSSDTDSGTKS